MIERDEIRMVDLLDLRLHAVTEAQCVELILDELDDGRGGWVITPNLDILRQASQRPELRALVQRADLLVADGMPLLWAAKMQGTPLPERVAGSNLISSLSAGAADRKRSLFLLGGMPGTADAAAAILKARHPELEVRGTYCPAFGFEKDPAQVDAIADAVREAAPDIVFVALGFPKGEHLTDRIRAARPEAWWVGVGISFSFLTGEVQRAPPWMQRAGLEWVHRLGQEPGRLAKRYLVHDIPFAGQLFARAAARRWKG